MKNKNNFQDFHLEAQNKNNIQQLMEKVEKLSIDWDNFDEPNNSKQSNVEISDIFNKSKKSLSEKSGPHNIQDSRDIMQISLYTQTNNNNKNFYYEKKDIQNNINNNSRYEKLKNMLDQAKKNNLQQFYKNIDKQHHIYDQQSNKFNNYQQFKQYINQLKNQKKKHQLHLIQKSLINPFNPINSYHSNQQYKKSKQNNYQLIQKSSQLQQQIAPSYNFQKKQQNLLPFQFGQQYIETNYIQQKLNPVSKYTNFYQDNQKLPDKAEEHNRIQDGIDFFQVDQVKNLSDKKLKQSKKILQPIREIKYDNLDKTFQQEKFQNLVHNYQNMYHNFQQLMNQLQCINQNKQSLITQLKNIKKQQQQKYSSQHKQHKQQQLPQSKPIQKQEQPHTKKYIQLKNEINTIKSSNKDIFLYQVNKKIQHLQSIVRSALQQINQQKQNKFLPISNHYQNQYQTDVNVKKNNKQQKYQQMLSKPNIQQSQQLFSSNNNIKQNNQKLPTDNTNNNTKLPKQSKPKQNTQQYSKHQSSISKINTNFNSPLDLQLQNTSVIYQDITILQQFTIEQFTQQYQPKQYQGYNKYLRNCLMQKSSVIFQSFDFHVSARFSPIDDQMYPVISTIRICNKCLVNIYDVHIIVYGPQGPGIQTDPSTIFHDEVKKNTSFGFQVSVDNSCLQLNGFNIQLSYKTDSMSKKKLNFKIPLPLIQLIRPEFIYQQKFINDWNSLNNQLAIKPKRLDCQYFRSHEDIKLILPFIELNEQNDDRFSYGVMFRYPRCQNIFYLKIICFVSGRAAIKLRTTKNGNRKFKQQILNVFNFLLFGTG